MPASQPHTECHTGKQLWGHTQKLRLRGNERDRVQVIAAAGAEALICGAISGPTMRDLLLRGVLVWPGAAGDVEEVIESLASSGELDEGFMMPGCGGHDRGSSLPCRHRHWGWWAG